MARKPRPSAESDYAPEQLPLTFETVMESAQVFSREQVVAKAVPGEGTYDPVGRTAAYVQRVVEIEAAWETTLQRAREELLTRDARQIYSDFLQDLKRQIEQDSANSANLGTLLEQVGIRGLGISRHHLKIHRPVGGGHRWRVDMNLHAIESHLDSHIVGEHFLNPVTIDETPKASHPLIVGASDVSQHRGAVPVPARYFKRTVPFVLNNAAGTLFRHHNGERRFDNLFNPRPDESLLRWMLIDPSYRDELEPEDYERCIGSAMDVGQYKFDLEYLLKIDRRKPDVIFRDGSLFPQDAYLDNFLIESKRGDFTRQAIRDLLACLAYAREVGTIYCGIAKNVQLKVYSAVVDWFIARNIDRNWSFGNYTLNDGQAMSLLLASPSFVGANLQHAVATCLVRRSFTTRANLNTRADVEDLEAYFQTYESQRGDVDITPFRRLCEIAHVYMFFIGHSKSPQQQLPRYEFFYAEGLGDVMAVARRILSALQYCGLLNDDDHSMMSATPVTYLIPSVTHQAHVLSKDVGRSIDSATGQWIMARYRRFLEP